MKKLTEKKAISLSIRMWKWLAKNPLCKKQDWPQYKKHKIESCLCECPLCEYYQLEYDCGCGYCPLGGDICGCASGYHKRWVNSLEKNDPYDCIESATFIYTFLECYNK